MPSRMRPAFDLVIFDCDGVLVDSEMLSAGVLMELLSEVGVPIDLEVFRSDFLGRSFAAASARLKARTGKPLPVDFHEQYLARLLPRFEEALKPMPGLEQLLARLRVKSCVASSSNSQRLATSLGCTGIARHFAPNIFSGASVANAKPAPDLFLFAAAAMDVSPNRILVIEDSEMGLVAARAANMAVWHFRGGSHFRCAGQVPSLARVEHTANDMPHLLDMFIANGLCSPD